MAQNCAATSIVDLALLLGRDLTQEERERVVERLPAPSASMLEMREAATSLGIAALGIKAAFGELATEVRGPKIIHLKDPDHYLVMVHASSRWVHVFDYGRVAVARRENIEKRYTGYALMVQGAGGGGPALRLHEFHHGFGIAGVGQVVEHAFRVSNVGDEDLVVALQASGCAAPEAAIGAEVLAPGESTDVTVKFEVRVSGNLMKSVTLLTNDLAQPVAFVTVHGTVPHDVRVVPDRLHLVRDKSDPAPGALSVWVSGPAHMRLSPDHTVKKKRR
jgi:hypothetical protein